MKRYDQLQEVLQEVKEDFEKFYDKGNKAAGTRIRKAMQSMKTLAQEIRVEVQEQKNKD